VANAMPLNGLMVCLPFIYGVIEEM
jgi:hypothetical protein